MVSVAALEPMSQRKSKRTRRKRDQSSKSIQTTFASSFAGALRAPAKRFEVGSLQAREESSQTLGERHNSRSPGQSGRIT